VTISEQMELLLSGMNRSRDSRSALATFRRHGGMLRTGQALAHGIHPATLYRLYEEGKVIRVTRGLYRLAQSPEFSNPDLAVVATKATQAVVCLISALAFHGITTQVPRVVHLAVPRGGYSRLTIGSPLVKVYRVDAATFSKGIEVHKVDGRPIRVYGIVRTVVDCFKFRNKIGLDVALEALRLARARKRISNREILEIARALRLSRVMAPYLQVVP
jgi:predicted transcriptional regulator of viral defense system